MDGHTWEDLFDAVEVNTDDSQESQDEPDCVLNSMDVQASSALDSEPSLKSCATITGLLPDIIFLGDSQTSDPHEINLIEALSSGILSETPTGSPRCGVDDSLAGVIMTWLQCEHRKIFDETALFVEQQLEHLMEHKETIGLRMLEQRKDLQHAMAAGPKMSRAGPLVLPERRLEQDCVRPVVSGLTNHDERRPTHLELPLCTYSHKHRPRACSTSNDKIVFCRQSVRCHAFCLRVRGRGKMWNATFVVVSTESSVVEMLIAPTVQGFLCKNLWRLEVNDRMPRVSPGTP